MLKLETMLKLEIGFPANQYFVHIHTANFCSSQVYPRLFEVENPILGQHNQDVVSQMKYTTVVDFLECWCMSILFPTTGCEPPLPVMLCPFLSSSKFNPPRFWHCECMLFHSWLQHAMTTSVTLSCFLSCSSSLSFSSFSAPVVSLLQTTHLSSVWIDSQDLVFLFYSVLF